MSIAGSRTGTLQTDPNDYFPLTLPSSQSFVKNSVDFNNAWNPIIVARENNFVKQLDIWKTKNNVPIPNTNNVFVIGEYQTRNWKISGLEIKTLSLPYYITSNTTTRASNTKESLAILEKLFVGKNALFQYNKNYSRSSSLNIENFNVILNSDVYNDFIARDVIIKEIYEYVTKQTRDFGTKNNFIQSTDKVQWATGGNTSWLNSTISSEISASQHSKIYSYQNWRRSYKW
ncbi:hypothetical protein [Spiroplasma endosymbiont of Virgichneumon dumeticola]|uniref:hypothetical protein n=1 Tax=Spiroplasma endosymbiont of Virgichneumon dumeticola TaxID=3139323 RepID=UPI0035C8F0F3